MYTLLPSFLIAMVQACKALRHYAILNIQVALLSQRGRAMLRVCQ